MIVTDQADGDNTDLFVAMAPVGVNPNSVMRGERVPGTRMAGVVPLSDRAVIAVGPTLFSITEGADPEPLITLDDDIATVTGDGVARIVVLLENGELHDVDLAPPGAASSVVIAGATPDGDGKPVPIQLQLSDDANQLDVTVGSRPTDISLDDSIDLALDGDDVLVLVDTTLVRLSDGTVTAVADAAERSDGQLRTGVDGPLWVEQGLISRVATDQ